MDMTSSNLARTYGDHRCVASFFSEFGYIAAFLNAGGSNLRDVVNDAKLRTI